ncbi:MAG: SRPBCC domain-containing protein [Bacteroidetes bacterium]|nr:SRPBCC domain-containing protein [Bacteroidota bacterium]
MEPKDKIFTLTRTFKAPRKKVFDAFSDAEALAKWWGPVEAPIDVIKLDFRPGGFFHYKMKGAQVNYGIFHYKEIDAPNSIVWVNSFANEKGEIIKPPFEGIDVPREMLVRITLSENNGATTLTLVSEPINASEKEIDTFNAIRESMVQGFGGTFNQLENYLAGI